MGTRCAICDDWQERAQYVVARAEGEPVDLCSVECLAQYALSEARATV